MNNNAANTSKDNVSLRPGEFHAGRFLRETLDDSGHTLAWLAARTGMTHAELAALFAMPNMDAELFVRIGLPMGQIFKQRVHEMIFGKGRCGMTTNLLI